MYIVLLLQRNKEIDWIRLLNLSIRYRQLIRYPVVTCKPTDKYSSTWEKGKLKYEKPTRLF